MIGFDAFNNPSWVDSHLRPALQEGLSTSLEEEKWSQAALYLAAFVDSWPIAGAMHRVEQLWQQHHDPMALAILLRSQEIAALLGECEDIELPNELPPHTSIAGEELAVHRKALCAKAARGEIFAVLFTSEVPLDSLSQLALGELRMEASSQRAVDMAGSAGLLCPDLRPWQHSLGPAPAGRMGGDGAQYRQMCDLAILPGTPNRLRAGNASPVGWLLWNGPAKPLAVDDSAVQILRQITTGAESEDQHCSLSTDNGQQILKELVAIGALTTI